MPAHKDPARRRHVLERVAAALGVVLLLLIPLTAKTGPLSATDVSGNVWPVRVDGAPSGGHHYLTITEVDMSALRRALGRSSHVSQPVSAAKSDVPLDPEMHLAMRHAFNAAAGLLDKRPADQLALVIHSDPSLSGLQRGDQLVRMTTLDGTMDADPMVTISWLRSVERCEACAGDLRITALRHGEEIAVTIRPDDQVVIDAVDDSALQQQLLPASWVRYEPAPIDGMQGATVAGPSAGLPFALAYLDRWVPGSLTGGLSIAATGEVDSLGTVGRVGGVSDKLAAAARAGVDVAFIPAGNIADSLEPGPEPRFVVPVTTVRDAVRWLCSHGADRRACDATVLVTQAAPPGAAPQLP